MAESWADVVVKAGVHEMGTHKVLSHVDFHGMEARRIEVGDSLEISVDPFVMARKGHVAELLVPVTNAEGVDVGACLCCGAPAVIGPAYIKVSISLVRVCYMDGNGPES